MNENLSQNNLDKSGKCPECGSRVLYSDDQRAELTCGTCGLVIQQRIINYGAEWREYDIDPKKSRARTGPPTSIATFDKGLSTEIGRDRKDAYGNEINYKTRIVIKRLNKWNYRTRYNKSTDRNLSTAMSELDKIASLINLPENIKQDSAYIYRKVVRKKITKGRSILELLLVSVYAACKQNNIPKSFDDLTAFDENLKKKRLSKYYKLIVNLLGLENKPVSPKIFIAKYCSELKLSENTAKLAVKIIDQAESKLVTGGKNPKAIVGAAIYIAALKNDERRTQKEISDIAGITEATIRNRYKELLKKLNLGFNFIT